jgi:hypothetical protein
MSKARSGNGRIAKYNRQVAEKAGLKKKDELLPYAPDFLDSLVRRMAIPVPGETAERCLAWLIYRANGNQSLKAIHLYSKNGEPPVETDLGQKDCALELAWVEGGHRVEWLDAPRDKFEAEAKRRGVKPIDKSVVSRGFQFNRDRGSMEGGTGFSLVYVPAPDATRFSYARESCRRKGENVQNLTKILTWAKVSYATEFHEFEVARATERRLLTFLTARYKKANGSQADETNGAPSLEALETLEALEAAPCAPAPVPAPPIEKREPSGGRAFAAAASDSRTEEPPARPPILSLPQQSAPDPPWYASLRVLLADKQVFRCGVPLDELMFRRIASHLTEELLPQFKSESEKANSIRKWAGYESIAKQVAACGLVPAAAAGPMKPPQSAKQGFVDSAMEEVHRRIAKYGRI